MAAAAIPEAAQAGRCGDRSEFGRGRNLEVVSLTDDQRLVRFRECRPERVKEIAPVSGLGGADSALVGIDFRVQDGLLYGVGNGGGITRSTPRPAWRSSPRSSRWPSRAAPSAWTSIPPRTGCA
jgi:hypothetical protein